MAAMEALTMASSCPFRSGALQDARPSKHKWEPRKEARKAPLLLCTQLNERQNEAWRELHNNSRLLSSLQPSVTVHSPYTTVQCLKSSQSQRSLSHGSRSHSVPAPFAITDQNILIVPLCPILQSINEMMPNCSLNFRAFVIIVFLHIIARRELRFHLFPLVNMP